MSPYPDGVLLELETMKPVDCGCCSGETPCPGMNGRASTLMRRLLTGPEPGVFVALLGCGTELMGGGSGSELTVNPP